MIHKSHCDTGIHCVSCRQDHKAYEAPAKCPYGVTKKTATTVVEGKKMTANDIQAKQDAYHALLREVSQHCKVCDDDGFCTFRCKSGCSRRQMIRRKEAECPMGKWSTRKI